MSDTRTEKPTPRRLREARRKGQGFTRSPEVAVAFSLLAAVLSLRFVAPQVARGLMTETKRFFAAATSSDPLGFAADRALPMVAGALVPFLAIALVAGVVSGVAQTGIVFTPAAAKPRLDNLSWKRGLERLKPGRVAWDLVRAAVKTALLVAFVWSSLQAWMQTLGARNGLATTIEATTSQAWGLVARTALAAVAVAIADYAINRWRTQKGLKMTKQEVKQELKDQEGDPILKMRRRRLAADISRNRMIFEVGHADVVIANPTHIAIALRYDPKEPAPRVVARGAGHLAERIKAEARRHGVFVTENRPLARALYKHCKVGQFIPASLYEAVAIVLATAFRRRGWAA
ncbi:MAG: EscU/YscU/HrcU family type III secretion system export apparatus switch protein [Actinomycetes bacterium]